jgi:hypothetical protein
MTVSLLHPLLAAAGLAAISVPIVIHLLLRQKPKPILFPALMLLKKKQTQTIRRLKIQNWLLLLLRCLVLLMLGLAIARPTVRSSLFALDQQAPIFAVMVFDDSPSMRFREKGLTRLEQAKTLAKSAIMRMPSGSKVAVVEASNPIASVFLEKGAAISRIDSLEPQSLAVQVNEALAAGIRSLIDQKDQRRELYVFSDQAANAWNVNDTDRLTNLFKESGPGLAVYVIDVHAEAIKNVAIDDWKLSEQVLPMNGDLEIDATIRQRGTEGDNIVRLIVDGEPRGEKPIRLSEGQAVTINLPVPGLREGFHQGELLLATGDEMPFDDRRYFTVDVRPAARVLIVSDNKNESIYWRKALDPEGGRGQDAKASSIDDILSSQLEGTNLDSYRVICLLHVSKLTPAAWIRVGEFVGQGGGLFVSLGPSIDPESYNSTTAQQLLPARLIDIAKPERAVLAPSQFTHPVMRPFGEIGNNDLADGPINGFWKVQLNANTNSTVIIPYSTGEAALAERTFGEGRRGRVLLLTTTTFYDPSGAAWNELPLGWSFVLLADEIVRYLAGAAETQLNFTMGEAITIDRHPSDPFTLYAITRPDKEIERITVDPRETVVTIPNANLPGQYRVDASQADRSFMAGFSVNIPPSESQLEPIEAEKIITLFGQNPVTVVRDPAALEQVEGTSRIGRELFPWIILLVAAALFGEAFLANRFYRSERQDTIPLLRNKTSS